jgi:hypothetical protein
MARESGLTPLRTIGDERSFATIDAVERVASGVAVLDASSATVSLYDDAGRLLDQVGRKGRGPGEFMFPVAMAADSSGHLLILDRGNQRLTVLDSRARPLQLIREVRLPFVPGTMCVARGKVFVSGTHAGRMIHVVSSDGTIVRSFASEPVADPLRAALTAMGRMACSQSVGAVAIAALTLRRMHVYSLDGWLVRTDSIPDFSETIYSQIGPSLRPRAPASGFVHTIAAMQWLDSTLLVQLEREPNGHSRPETRRLRLEAGWDRSSDWWPKVLGILADTVYTAEEDPYPVVRAYTTGSASQGTAPCRGRNGEQP